MFEKGFMGAAIFNLMHSHPVGVIVTLLIVAAAIAGLAYFFAVRVKETAHDSYLTSRERFYRLRDRARKNPDAMHAVSDKEKERLRDNPDRKAG